MSESTSTTTHTLKHTYSNTVAHTHSSIHTHLNTNKQEGENKEVKRWKKKKIVTQRVNTLTYSLAIGK